MALPICLEAVIRLFFELVRFFLGDVTLIFKSGFFDYLEVGLPVMLSRLWFLAIFVVIMLVFRQDFMRNLVILSIPAVINFFSDAANVLPGGQFIGVPGTILGVFVSATAWAFLVLSNPRIHPLLRLVAVPGMMVLGAINAIQPASFVGDILAFVGFTYMAEIAAFLAFIVIGVIVIISPPFICGSVNKVLVVIEGFRYEGFGGAWSALWSIFIFFRNKAFQINR